VGYSPLWLQGRFISSETIHLHWWQGGSGWGVVDWPALLVPLALTAVGFGAVLRHISGASGRTLVAAAARPPEADEGSGPHPTLYVAAVLLAALALLLWQTPAWRSTGQAQIAARIAAGERRADDAILHLIPTATQEFANAYHGRLATWGLRGIWPAGDVQALLARLQERNVKRLWVVPDAGPAELSPWEFELRTNHYLLSEVRPTGAEGPRLALYALAGAQPQNETGLGTLFADPELAGAEITDQNSWIRLAGYWLPAEAQAGAELLLTLRWESLQPVADEYNVFVHLLDQRGERVAQRDGRPVQWLRPIPTWQPGESVIDRYGIPLPADLPPGIYTIAVGLYDPVSGRRLPVNAGPRDYAVELGPISILAP